MTISKVTTAILLGCAAFASACTDPSDDDDVLAGDDPPGSFGDPDGPVRGASTGIAETPGDVAVPPAGAPPLVTTGTYRLTSNLFVPPGRLLPASAGEAVRGLERLRDRPSETLFALARDAGAPAVQVLRAELSPELAEALDGWVDEHVRAVSTDHGPIDHAIGEVLAIYRSDVDAIHLDSQLVVGGGAVLHRLDAVELDVLARSMSFDVAPLVHGSVAVRAAATITRDDTGATIAITRHDLELPYGAIAWGAAEQLVGERFGQDLRAVLGAQLDCAGLASEVSRRCFAGKCVDHAEELEQVCEAGLDHAVNVLRGAVVDAPIEPLVLDAGRAHLTDGDPVDGVASAIEDGRWTARVDVGQGVQDADGKFTGARE